MNFLQETGQSVVGPIKELIWSFWSALPNVFSALLVLIVGYVISVLVGWIISGALDKIHFDKWVAKSTNFNKIFGNVSITNLLTIIAKWSTFVLFFGPASDMLSDKMVTLSNFLSNVQLWIPNLIAAVLVALVGFVAADYVALHIAASKAKGASVVAGFAKLIIRIFAALIALSQVGVDVSIAENSFLIILAGIMLAIGIGFGAALKDDARAMLNSLKKKI